MNDDKYQEKGVVIEDSEISPTRLENFYNLMSVPRTLTVSDAEFYIDGSVYRVMDGDYEKINSYLHDIIIDNPQSLVDISRFALLPENEYTLIVMYYEDEQLSPGKRTMIGTGSLQFRKDGYVLRAMSVFNLGIPIELHEICDFPVLVNKIAESMHIDIFKPGQMPTFSLD